MTSNPVEAYLNEKGSFEAYFFINNVDELIVKINPLLKSSGYKFVLLDFDYIERNFTDFFYKREFNIIGRIFDFKIRGKNNKLAFLKQIEVIKTKGDLIDALGKGQRLENEIIQKLRYFKNGDVRKSVAFIYDKENTSISMSITSPDSLFGEKLSFENEKEIRDFKKFFQQPFENNSLVEIADASFNLSYEIDNPKIKFITLMTALESLFNQGKDQIAHTISRHLAIIISKNRTEFENNYSKIKELYNLRNTIVHGSSNIKQPTHSANKGKKQTNLTEKNIELQNLVRIAINYCRNLTVSKKELFQNLNAKGFK